MHIAQEGSSEMKLKTLMRICSGMSTTWKRSGLGIMKLAFIAPWPRVRVLNTDISPKPFPVYSDAALGMARPFSPITTAEGTGSFTVRVHALHPKKQ